MKTSFFKFCCVATVIGLGLSLTACGSSSGHSAPTVIPPTVTSAQGIDLSRALCPNPISMQADGMREIRNKAEVPQGAFFLIREELYTYLEASGDSYAVSTAGAKTVAHLDCNGVHAMGDGLSSRESSAVSALAYVIIPSGEKSEDEYRLRVLFVDGHLRSLDVDDQYATADARYLFDSIPEGRVEYKPGHFATVKVLASESLLEIRIWLESEQEGPGHRRFDSMRFVYTK